MQAAQAIAVKGIRGSVMATKRAAPEELDASTAKKPATAPLAAPPAENKRHLRSSHKKAQAVAPSAPAQDSAAVSNADDRSGSVEASNVADRAVTQLERCFPSRVYRTYYAEMLLTLKEREAAHRLTASPLSRPPGCTAALRDKHVHHIVQMANHRAMGRPLPAEVQHLAVSYMDRYLSKMRPDQSQLPLLSLTCLRLATKMECVQPAIGTFLQCYEGLSGHKFRPQHLCAAELQVTNTLGWDLSLATVPSFLELFLTLANAPGPVREYAKYLSTLTLYDATFSLYLPSLVACVAVSLAADVHGSTAWTPEFKDVVGCSARDASYVDSLLRLRKLAEVLATRAIPR